MSQVKKNKLKFSEWIMTYRKLIFVVLFFILLPLIVIIGLYSGTKANGKKVYFSEDSKEYIKTSKFIDIENFDAFNLTIDYKEVQTLYDMPEEEDGEEFESGKKYTFVITYDDNLHNVSNVSITPVLVGPWSSYQARLASLNLSKGTDRSVAIDFKKVTPYKPLLFVRVVNPMLYLEVKYSNAGHQLVSYVSFDLSTDKEVIIK